MNFVDRVRIHAKGGRGGAGVSSFLRAKGRPRGKPTGGSGGGGGDVVLKADRDVASLLAFSRHAHWNAGDGAHGQGDLRHGAVGDDLVLPVPLGTVVRDDAGTMLADLVEPGQEYRLAGGGRGGRGNAAFVTPQRRAPTFAEQGEYGEEVSATLELKVLADAALVGFPNAGKSTLISRVSAAKPKVADYPFTTLTPHLGIVDVDGREFALADVPGLIEGAAEGRGLGHDFLRHVERATVLVLLLDPTPLQDTPYPEQLTVLERELEAHSPGLAQRARLVVVNKIDAVPDWRDVVWWSDERALDAHLVSGVTGQGVDGLMHAIADLLADVERVAPSRDGFTLHRPLGSDFRVVRRGDEWVVEGLAAERAVNLSDLTVPEAADFVAERLSRVGVDAALLAAGAQTGDDVRIGDIVFTFEPEAER